MKKAVVLVLCFCLVALGMAFAEVRTGTVTATGSALTVKTGAKPQIVHVTNITNGASLHYNASMTAGHGVRMISNASADAAGIATVTIISSGGITPYDGTVVGGQILNAPGFTIGTDAHININTNTLKWEAVW